MIEIFGDPDSLPTLVASLTGSLFAIGVYAISAVKNRAKLEQRVLDLERRAKDLEKWRHHKQ